MSQDHTSSTNELTHSKITHMECCQFMGKLTIPGLSLAMNTRKRNHNKWNIEMHADCPDFGTEFKLPTG